MPSVSPTVHRVALARFAIQAGFHGYPASLPLALSRAGTPDPSIGLIMGTAALVQIPASLLGGRLVDRFGGTRMLIVGGAFMTIVSVALLLLPPETPLRILAGFLGGAGGAFVITPVLVESGGKPAGPPPMAEPT
jgi:MFS family permease